MVGPVISAPTATATSRDGLLIAGLSHRFGDRRVVDGVALEIAPGEIHCLVGPSGCGKTTTLRLIAGLEALQAGRITLSGRLLAEPGLSLPPERRRVGLMFQDLALFPHLCVGENVAFGVARLDRRRREQRVMGLLAAVNMGAYARAYPQTLSGGEQQRVALARALASEPELMLLDEAFSALDASLRAQVRDEALSLLRETGAPTLLVTHDAEEATQVGDRIHVMQAGRIVQNGTPAELYAAPVDPFVAGFFGPVHRFHARVVRGRVATPLGTAPARGMAENAPALVIVRPEALQVRRPADRGGVRARVLVRRDLGPVRLLRLRLADGSSIEVRRAGRIDAAVGEEVAIELDPRHLFVYPAPG
jgi:iron(III) transport system ATP-binding protein